MNEKKEDYRTRYTKMIIRQALFDLMKSNTINKISVTEICKLAGINRGTFYNYYTDPYDLIVKIEDEFYSDVKAALEKSSYANSSELMTEIVEYMYKNVDLIKVLTGTNGDEEFVRRIVYIGYEKSLIEWKSIKPYATANELELLYVFITYGIVGIIKNWLSSDTPKSPKEVASYIQKLIEKCVM